MELFECVFELAILNLKLNLIRLAQFLNSNLRKSFTLIFLKVRNEKLIR
jgi:hypothetical protein